MLTLILKNLKALIIREYRPFQRVADIIKDTLGLEYAAAR
jgi:hypothetical protein